MAKPAGAYRPQAMDTSEDIDRKMIEIYRRMSPAEKIQRLFALSETSRYLNAIGMRQLFPGITDREIRIRQLAASVDVETLNQAFGSQ